MRSYLLLGLLLLPCLLPAQSADSLNQASLALIQAEKYTEALPLVQQAAALGQPQAQFHLGIMYANGIAMERNDSLAAHWWLLAARQAWRDAQFMTAQVCFSHNKPQEGLSWLQAAANNGDFEAMYLHAMLQLEGKAMPADTLSGLPAARALAFRAQPRTHDDSAYVALIRCQLANAYYKDIWQTDLSDIDVYAWLLICNECKRLLPFPRQNEIIYQIEQLGYNLDSGEKQAAADMAGKWMGAALRNVSKTGNME
ncbi:MAG: sel1 repeat family protein [Bacteroidetes bacterium]|nr:sel1 repeat family protein [Bacteroidota bacterium]